MRKRFFRRAIQQLSEGIEDTTKEDEQRRIEFNFPLLIVRTKRFSAIFEKMGRLRGSRYISWVFLLLVPFVAGVAFYLIVNSVIGLLLNPAVGQIFRELGPGSILLLPGINPLLPIVYGWIAIVFAIVVHEGAHGVIARNVGLNVKSSGILFFLIVPIGAFVDVDEEQIKKARPRHSLKVMAAGVGSNVLVGALCLLCLLVVVGSLTPTIDGIFISDVTQGMPAQAAGLLPNDVLVSVDNITINTSTDLRAILDKKTAEDTVQVTVARGDRWQYRYSTTSNLTVSENRTILGFMGGDLLTKERLQNYQDFSVDRLVIYMVPPTLASSAIPFSDSLAPFYSSSIPYWQILANALFWVWFVNFNLAIFNALPIYPLDGGRIFNITLKKFAGKRLSEKAAYSITIAATAVCVILVLLGFVLPFIY